MPAKSKARMLDTGALPVDRGLALLSESIAAVAPDSIEQALEENRQIVESLHDLSPAQKLCAYMALYERLL